MYVCSVFRNPCTHLQYLPRSAHMLMVHEQMLCSVLGSWAGAHCSGDKSQKPDERNSLLQQTIPSTDTALLSCTGRREHSVLWFICTDPMTDELVFSIVILYMWAFEVQVASTVIVQLPLALCSPADCVSTCNHCSWSWPSRGDLVQSSSNQLVIARTYVRT